MPRRKITCRFRALTLTILISGNIILWLSPTATGQPRDNPEIISLTLSSAGIKDSFEFAPDQIGLIPNPRISQEQMFNLGNQYGAEFVQAYPGGISVYKFFSEKSRQELFNIAREIRETSPDVTQAGIVSYPVGSNLPVVITDGLVVLFRKGIQDSDVQEFARLHELDSIMHMPRIRELQLFRLNKNSSKDILEVSEIAGSNDKVIVVHPRLVAVIDYRQAVSHHQWHHLNSGQAGRGPPATRNGAVDSDIDTDLAWEFTEGVASISIAILDQSFDVDENAEPGHPDYLANLWSNPDESGANADNGEDDPVANPNGFIDDVHGFNFVGCEETPGLPCGTGVISEISNETNVVRRDNGHGTAVAGLVAGSNSSLGFLGSCPNCSLILLQQGLAGGPWVQGLGITYAKEVGARIMNNSWGFGNIRVPVEVETPIQVAVQSGMVIFWAMKNEEHDYCADHVDANGSSHYADVSANPNVIAISAISNQERKVTRSGFGDCMELLSPSHGGYGTGSVPYTGSLNIATTDRTGTGDFDIITGNTTNAGYNNEFFSFSDPLHLRWASDYCPNELAGSSGHTLCFGGTSASAPIAAGVAGLVLSADSSLTPIQVQRLLQDTADKVQDSDPDLTDLVHTGANYSLETGKSTHAGGVSTHGYGRINAFEAVRLVTPASEETPSGLGRKDIFVRDNRLDWGNTSQLESSVLPGMKGSNVLMDPERGTIAHYKSVDIKVDVENSQPAPMTSMAFDSLIHKNPVSLANNQVYVRVHNRGPDPASNVEVRLYLVEGGAALPSLPIGFWSDTPPPMPFPPADPSEWALIGTRTIDSVPYSGASLAGGNEDLSQIASFNFIGPSLDQSRPGFRHYCLMVVITSDDDPVSVEHLDPSFHLIPDIVTPTTNNVTHRNVNVQDAANRSSDSGLMIRNPFEKTITARLAVVKPKHWKVVLSEFSDGEEFVLETGKEVPVEVTIEPQGEIQTGDVEIRQEVLFNGKFHTLGGFVFRTEGR